jgi:hypothetical protein
MPGSPAPLRTAPAASCSSLATRARSAVLGGGGGPAAVPGLAVSSAYWRAVHAMPEARRPNARQESDERTHPRSRRRRRPHRRWLAHELAWLGGLLRRLLGAHLVCSLHALRRNFLAGTGVA